MSDYQAPINDMLFTLHDVINIIGKLQDLKHPLELDEELVNAILEEAGRFASQVWAPINRNGDEQGCQFDSGLVSTPDGFKQAYQQFVESGWASFYASDKYGGQGMPKALHVLLEEMLYASNTSLCLYPSLTTGAIHAILTHASDELKDIWLPKMVEGRWAGAMCLTESHAGTDLGLIKTKAQPTDDGHYEVTGTKIFITGGEQDLTENIVHLVLARVAGAPEGVKGISLFIVPKMTLDDQGNIQSPNAVHCGSIEHKMGIKGSATCVMNFDGAKAYLVGEENQGLKYMFSMMNNERLSIGIQGIGLTSRSLQTATAYAKERLQSRGPLDKKSDTSYIVEHPDVRKMLFWMRSHLEASRVSLVWLGLLVDRITDHPEATERAKADKLVAFMTPVAKAFYSDFGFEACNKGLQVLGGHGYIREWGQEQLVRDARIAQIYEGTNGIQAMDLIGRKLLSDGGEGYQLFKTAIWQAVASLEGYADIQQSMQKALDAHYETTEWILNNSQDRPALAGSVATDYLQFTGICWFASMWALALNGLKNSRFLNSQQKQEKEALAQFFCQKVLVQYQSLQSSIYAGEDSLMMLSAEQI